MNTRNLILFLLSLSCVTGCRRDGSSTSLGGCRDTVTLLNPLGGTTKLEAECSPGQTISSQITPNNSVIATCTCVRETACRCHSCDGGACEVPQPASSAH